MDFAKLPNNSIEKFDGQTLKVYAALIKHCRSKSECFPGNDRISVMTGIKSYTTIIAAKKELEREGLITTNHRNGTSNNYRVKKPKAKKDFLTVPIELLKLPPGAFKLWCYLQKKTAFDDTVELKTSTIKKDLGVNDTRTLYKYVATLKQKGLLAANNPEKGLWFHAWQINKTPEFLKPNPGKNEIEPRNNCNPSEKNVGISETRPRNNWNQTPEFLESNKYYLIDLYLIDSIMQNKKDFQTEEQGQNQDQGQDPFPLPEQNLENFPAEDSEQKVPPPESGFRFWDNKKRRQIRAQEGTFSKKEWAILLDAYEKKLTEKQKAIVNEYVCHEWQMYDVNPMDKDRETETRKFLICEFLSKQRRQIPERYKIMTPEQRQAELENDLVAQHRMNYIENYTPPVDADDLMALWRNQYKPFYEKQM